MQKGQEHYDSLPAFFVTLFNYLKYLIYFYFCY